MMTDKTKTILSWGLAIIGIVMLFSSILHLTDLISWFDEDLSNMWSCWSLVLLICAIAIEPIKKRQIESGGNLLVVFLLLTVGNFGIHWSQIQHFTAPVVVSMVLQTVCTLIAGVKIYDKSKKIQALREMSENN